MAESQNLNNLTCLKLVQVTLLIGTMGTQTFKKFSCVDLIWNDSHIILTTITCMQPLYNRLLVGSCSRLRSYTPAYKVWFVKYLDCIYN